MNNDRLILLITAGIMLLGVVLFVLAIGIILGRYMA